MLTEQPSAPGALRLSGRVSGPGAGVQTDDGGWTFAGEDGRSVRYGAPIAFDAERRPMRVRATVERDTLALELDGADLATARFPVTIDPHIVAGPTLVYDATDGMDTDVTFNHARGEFLVVFSAAVDPALREIRAQRFNALGTLIGSSWAVATGGHQHAPARRLPAHVEPVSRGVAVPGQRPGGARGTRAAARLDGRVSRSAVRAQ